MKPASAKYKHSNTLEEYWEQRVKKSPDNSCWKFATKGDKDGYPQIQGSKVCKKANVARAHQLSYLLFRGPIPDGMFVCHKCDNPWCVNPEHLFLGSPNDNVQDMMIKGRYKHPTLTHQIGKLSKKQKREIINSRDMTALQLAKKYNISWSRVYQIWRDE
jgi:hypothetical protein